MRGAARILHAHLTLHDLHPPLTPHRYEALRRFRIVNYYAKFASMHAFRWELVLEGSDDGVSWAEYGWRYKPWRAERRPPWVVLHLPRLDWRVWFLPLGCKRQGASYEPPAWLHGLLRALLRHEPAVLRLLDPRHCPFPHAPPRYGVRTRLVDFRIPDAPSGERAWETTPLPRVGKFDTSSLCLELRYDAVRDADALPPRRRLSH